MKAKATTIMIPIHVGTVASLTIIASVAAEAFVAAPVETPPTLAALLSSFRTIKPIAKTIAIVTIERMNPCMLPT